MIPRPPTSTLFPYTTLFRSQTRLEYGTLSMFVICTGKITDSSPVVTRLERSEEHTSELQSQSNLVCRLLLEKKNYTRKHQSIPTFIIACIISLGWAASSHPV